MFSANPTVAPFTGAWIEMYGVTTCFSITPVAPFTGAWIEIGSRGSAAVWDASLPSRERGLKSPTLARIGEHGQSLPSRERGLKSLDRKRKYRFGLSLPSRERGLKSGPSSWLECGGASLPSRERGLKCAKIRPIRDLRRRSLHGSVD